MTKLPELFGVCLDCVNKDEDTGHCKLNSNKDDSMWSFNVPGLFDSKIRNKCIKCDKHVSINDVNWRDPKTVRWSYIIYT